MYQLLRSKQFKKSFKKIQSHKHFKSEVFDYVIKELLAGNKLDAKYLPHALAGDYLGYFDCHVQNDILLIYKYHHEQLILVLANIGSHSNLFVK